jgi:hypothetical protein
MEAGYCRGPGPSRAVAPQMMMMMMIVHQAFQVDCTILRANTSSDYI